MAKTVTDSDRYFGETSLTRAHTPAHTPAHARQSKKSVTAVTAGVPSWLRERVGFGRGATVKTCKHCGAKTLCGLDADNVAASVIVEVVPISLEVEILALTHGVPTYDVEHVRGQLEINYRNQWRTSRRWPVVPAHVCGISWPADGDDVTARPVKTEDHDTPDECPF